MIDVIYMKLQANNELNVIAPKLYRRDRGRGRAHILGITFTLALVILMLAWWL